MSHAIIRTGAVGGRRLVAVIASLIVLMLSAGQAQASTPGDGTFEGWEYPPPSTVTNETTRCAAFNPTEAWPDTDAYGLVQYIEMDGTFHGDTGTGVAKYENKTTKYNASPLGTYAPNDDDCSNLNNYEVPGTVTITFGSYTCEGPGLYKRQATSAYTLEADVDCDADGVDETHVEFTGVQVVCDPFVGCSGAPSPDPVDPYGPSSAMTGLYEQTG